MGRYELWPDPDEYIPKHPAPCVQKGRVERSLLGRVHIIGHEALEKSGSVGSRERDEATVGEERAA